jgi:hypothetical protein
MKQIRSIGSGLILSICILSGYAQGREDGITEENADNTVYKIKTFGSVSTDGQTPFWITGNQYGIVPVKANNGYLQAGVYHSQPLGRGLEWKAGLDLVAATPRYRNVYIRQIFTAFNYRWLHLSIGSRGGYDYNQSLMDHKLSSGDLGLSANARPIPEVNLFIPQFVTIPGTKEWLQGKGNFAVGRSFDTDYLNSFANDGQIYIRNVLWHHKSLYIRVKNVKSGSPASFTLGIRHFAQWGGTSSDPSANPRIQPHSLKDFARIIVGRSGGSDASLSDQINVLGNHYGTYDFRFDYEKENWAISGYHQHFFDDASGMEFNNPQDGLTGIQLSLPEFQWINKIVIERLYTLHQSGPFHFIEFDHSKYPGYGGGGDNYYNNGEYTTGASYFNRSLGSPLLLSPEYNTDGSIGFKHNRVRAWHLGAEGNIAKDFSYRLRVSTMESFGIPYMPTLKKLANTSFTLDFHYLLRNSWMLSASLAADRGTLLGDRFGFGLSVAKWGIIRGK